MCLVTCDLQLWHLDPQNKRLQNVQNSLARAVTRTPKSCHITPVRSLHWLRINERIKYKLLSVTYKVLPTNQPQYLHNLISVQPCHGTRSSSTVTLTRPPSRSSLKITNHSFRYAAPCLWNELPTELRLPRHTQSSPPSPSVAHGSSSPPLPPPSPLSVTTSVFHSELKTWLFGKSFPP